MINIEKLNKFWATLVVATDGESEAARYQIRKFFSENDIHPKDYPIVSHSGDVGDNFHRLVTLLNPNGSQVKELETKLQRIEREVSTLRRENAELRRHSTAPDPPEYQLNTEQAIEEIKKLEHIYNFKRHGGKGYRRWNDRTPRMSVDEMDSLITQIWGDSRNRKKLCCDFFDVPAGDLSHYYNDQPVPQWMKVILRLLATIDKKDLPDVLQRLKHGN